MNELKGLFIELTQEDRQAIKIEAAKRGVHMRVLVLEAIRFFILSTSDSQRPPVEEREKQR